MVCIRQIDSHPVQFLEEKQNTTFFPFSLRSSLSELISRMRFIRTLPFSNDSLASHKIAYREKRVAEIETKGKNEIHHFINGTE